MKRMVYLLVVSTLLILNYMAIHNYRLPARATQRIIDKLISQPISTDWNITVLGVIRSSNSNSVAVVKNDQDGKISVVRVGDRLFNLAKLIDIQKDRILFERDDYVEYKLIKDSDEIVSATPSPANPSNDQPVQTRYVEEGFKRVNNEVTMTQPFRDNLLTTKLSSVLYQAMALPRVINGNINGFTISEITQGSIYEKLGIKNDDVVTEINDTQLDDMSKTIALLNTLREENEISFQVERGGKKQSFFVRIK